MKSHKFTMLGALVLGCLFFSGCASSVIRPGAGAAPAPLAGVQATAIKSVSISLSPKVQQRLRNSLKFSQESLRSMVQNHLAMNNLMKPNQADGLAIEILVSDIRIRNTFNAVMFGVMSGADYLDGEITVRNAAGDVVDSFKVSASYALGGYGGGQDGLRMNWLYEAFAKELRNGLKLGGS